MKVTHFNDLQVIFMNKISRKHDMIKVIIKAMISLCFKYGSHAMFKYLSYDFIYNQAMSAIL